jgi:DNA-binding beta-propeller fold protein YncE
MLRKHNVATDFSAFIGVIVVICSGCGQPTGELFTPPAKPIVWPAPPETARIKYVGQISTEKDLHRSVSWSEGFGQFLFGQKEIGVLLNPYGVVLDDNDRLFVSDSSGSVIHLMDLKTRRYKQLSELADNEKLATPVALTIVEGQIFVVDSGLARICVFDREGKFKFCFGQGRLKRPSGIAYWPGGEKVYVSDTSRHVVNVFSRSGEFLDEIGSRGLTAGKFNFPTQLWVDHSGRLYVSDTLNYRIQVFKSDGTFLFMFGEQGDRPGNFAHPCGVATDSLGNIYVTDRQFENVQIFDRFGRILMAFGQEGTGIGQFWLPAGIWIDSSNRIYVADSFNKRIQVFQLLIHEEQ